MTDPINEKIKAEFRLRADTLEDLEAFIHIERSQHGAALTCGAIYQRDTFFDVYCQLEYPHPAEKPPSSGLRVNLSKPRTGRNYQRGRRGRY